MSDAVPGSLGDAEPAGDDSVDEASVPALRCRGCGMPLADPGDLFPSSRSLQVNPHGYLHEIVTVSEARNLVGAGQPSTEATWFAGYAWDIVCCVGCRAHVGWRFEGAGPPPVFYGLRLAAITEA
jgi:cereblon